MKMKMCASDLIVVFVCLQCLTLPTPNIRKKRNPPIPTPRRRSSASDVHSSEAPTFSADESPADMSDVRGTFRRIDEDELEKKAPMRRVLTASLSAPAGSRTKLFSFFKWFKRDKRKNDMTLESLNVPSVPSSPMFPRNRLTNAESVDTLSSLATVSSFAFLSGAEYRNLGANQKKRRAPLPPIRKDVSLPNTMQCRVRAQHRRSSSESSKGRTSASFLHVNGKRKAPPPPPTNAEPSTSLYPSLPSLNGSTISRRKQPAPLPPVTNPSPISKRFTVSPQIEPIEPTITLSDSSAPPEVRVGTDTNTSTNASEHIQQPTITVSASPVPPATIDSNVSTDTLTLERGILRPTKPVSPSQSPLPSKPAPVSPRPWYKRKSLEKRKEKVCENWMPEGGIARPQPPPSPETAFSKLNFFFEKKKEEKRKSGLSLLANISELDREAAEICRKEQNYKQKLVDDDDSKFYMSEPKQLSPKLSSTKELISLFNAIGNGSNIYQLTEPNVSRQNKGTSQPESTSSLETNEKIDDNVTTEARFNINKDKDDLSTIAEMSEPSSSVATLNYYSERVWTCTRCTLENLLWKNRCDACNACKPNFNRTDKRRSEMEFDIDWEQELQKYFPLKGSPLPGQTTKSKSNEGSSKTEAEKAPSPGDLNELRKKRIEFFMKSLGKHHVTSVRDAAAKKSLDEGEKSKLKGMLKEMKNSISKDDAAKSMIDDIRTEIIDSNKIEEDKLRYGAIKKTPLEVTKSAEALLVTTTTVLEDITIRKKEVENLKIQGGKIGKKDSDKNFQLMRARDLANIIELKSEHVYANQPFIPQPQVRKFDQKPTILGVVTCFHVLFIVWALMFTQEKFTPGKCWNTTQLATVLN